MHPGRCARVVLNGRAIGHVGELHPKWRQAYELAQAPVMFELELDAVLQRDVPAFKEVLKHQPVERDLAIVVAESVTHDAVLQAVWAAPTEGLLRDALLFDVYRAKTLTQGTGESAPALGEKSLALRLTLNGVHESLTEAQIEAAVKAVLTCLVTGVSARLRA